MADAIKGEKPGDEAKLFSPTADGLAA